MTVLCVTPCDTCLWLLCDVFVWLSLWHICNSLTLHYLWCFSVVTCLALSVTVLYVIKTFLKPWKTCIRSNISSLLGSVWHLFYSSITDQSDRAESQRSITQGITEMSQTVSKSHQRELSQSVTENILETCDRNMFHNNVTVQSHRKWCRNVAQKRKCQRSLRKSHRNSNRESVTEKLPQKVFTEKHHERVTEMCHRNITEEPKKWVTGMCHR